jgi:hypothetical protein
MEAEACILLADAGRNHRGHDASVLQAVLSRNARGGRASQAPVLLPLQGGLWAFQSFATTEQTATIAGVCSATFIAFVSVSAAVGFVVYGGRLFLMLQRFPIESRGRKKKLREVGLVTAICAACFSIR